MSKNENNIINERKFNIYKAFSNAYNSSLSGMLAMGSQVTLLMWLRTSVNYQYKYGGGFNDTFQKIYTEGGLRRFYQGYSIAILQAPLSRFGDIASYSIISQYSEVNNISLPVQTAIGTICSCFWRFNLMPIDTCKTMLQVHGNKGLVVLREKIKTQGIRSLYHGYIGTLAATTMGYYPWFFTFGYLDKNIRVGDNYLEKLTKSAVIGFAASLTSDIVSNSVRVLKTIRQTSELEIGYFQHAKNIILKDGFIGFATRGLVTKIISNGIQSATFTILWKYLENYNNSNK
jgi:hypothetical protein